ncbi:MAG: 4Fe-4S binding protein, partial [Deltaproteobacteria bacterium]
MSGGRPTHGAGRRPAATARHRAWAVLRKLCQLAVLATLVYAAVGTHWRNYKVAHNSARLVGLLTNDAWATLYDINDRALTGLGEWTGHRALELSESTLGAPWAFRVAGWTFVDPWAAGAVLAQGHGPPAAMLLGALVPLVLALALGRLYCSFICPARLLFELSSAVRLGLLRLGLPLPAVALPRVGLWVGVAGLLFAASAGAGVFHFLLPYLSLSSGVISVVLSGGIGAAGAAFVGMLLVDGLVAPGQICHSLCPTGALLAVVGRGSRLRLRKRPTPCPRTCNLCQRACPYGLFPGQDTHRPACDTCGRCTLVCPEGK